jgi:hypothetical protein
VTDTVGFIHKLPHQLVDAFRATLEEVTRADVLIEIVDAADAHFAEHRTTVQAVLDELDAGANPRVVALIKVDLLESAARDGSTPAPTIGGAVFVSARTGYGLDTLRAEIAAVLASLWVGVDVALPYAAGELLARVRERGTVELEYRDRESPRGRVAPSLAPSWRRRAARWTATLREAGAGRGGAVTSRCAPAGGAATGGGDRIVWSIAEGVRGPLARIARARRQPRQALLLETSRAVADRLELTTRRAADAPPRAGRARARQRRDGGRRPPPALRLEPRARAPRARLGGLRRGEPVPPGVGRRRRRDVERTDAPDRRFARAPTRGLAPHPDHDRDLAASLRDRRRGA